MANRKDSVQRQVQPLDGGPRRPGPRCDRRCRAVEEGRPLRQEQWFWHPNDESSLKSVSELLDTYNRTVGRGAQLMIGLAPDNRGLLPDADVKRLEEFGKALNTIYAPENNLADQATNASVYHAALDSDPDTVWSPPE